MAGWLAETGGGRDDCDGDACLHRSRRVDRAAVPGGGAESEELRREHFSLLPRGDRGCRRARGEEPRRRADGRLRRRGAALACCGRDAAGDRRAQPVGRSRWRPHRHRSGRGRPRGRRLLRDPGRRGGTAVRGAAAGEILVTEFVRMLARLPGRVRPRPCRCASSSRASPEPVDAYRVRWEPRSRAGEPLVAASAPGAALAVPAVRRPNRGAGSSRQALRPSLSATVGRFCCPASPGSGRPPWLPPSPLRPCSRVPPCSTGGAMRICSPVPALDRGAGPPRGACERGGDRRARGGVRCGAGARRPGGVAPQPRTCHRPGSGRGEAARHLLFKRLPTSWLELRARAGVLLLDDLHWADEGSVQLLRHVLSASRSMRVLVIGTFRDSDVGSTHVLADVLARLHREHGVERTPCSGAGRRRLLAYLEKLAGHEMGAAGVAFRDVLLAETDGNPFFVGEIVRHLRETGAIYPGRAGHLALELRHADDGPPGEHPGGRGTADGHARARDASGASPWPRSSVATSISRSLVRVADVDEDALIDLCDLTVEAAVLREGERSDSYCFTHALIEYSLYDEQSTHRRHVPTGLWPRPSRGSTAKRTRGGWRGSRTTRRRRRGPRTLSGPSGTRAWPVIRRSSAWRRQRRSAGTTMPSHSRTRRGRTLSSGAGAARAAR